jgi:hypothetical protein
MLAPTIQMRRVASTRTLIGGSLVGLMANAVWPSRPKRKSGLLSGPMRLSR